MADIKIIIVEHLIKMHIEIWNSMNTDTYLNHDDDKKKVYKLIQRFESIQNTLKDIAMSENRFSPKQKLINKSNNESSYGAF